MIRQMTASPATAQQSPRDGRRGSGAGTTVLAVFAVIGARVKKLGVAN